MADEAEVVDSEPTDTTPDNTPDDITDPIETEAPDSDPLADPDEQTEAISEDDLEPQAQEKNAAPIVNAPSVQTIALAAQLGLDPHEIAEYQSEEELSRAVRQMTRRFQQQQNKDSGQKPQQAEELSIEAFPMPNADNVSEDVTAWATAMKDFVGKVLENTQRSVGAIQQGLSQSSQVQQEREFEAALNAVADAEKLFGKGSHRALKKAGKNAEFQNRVKLWGAAQNYIKAAEQRGEYVDMEEAVTAAYQVAFPKDASSKARAEIAKSLEKRKGAMSSMPSSRNTSTPADPDKAALAAMAKFREERAMGKSKLKKK